MVTKLTVILIYAFLYSLALNLFWQPGNIYAGGLTGIAQIIATGLAKSHIEVPYFSYILSPECSNVYACMVQN